MAALPYDPDSWVRYQLSTNCYDYACNNRPKRKEGSKSQPGVASGLPLGDPLTCENVTAAAIGDRLIAVLDGQDVGRHTDCGFECWKVALFISEEKDGAENDYHWLREDALGGWSHKRDHHVVYDTGADGHPIRDPETANLDYRNATNGVTRSPHNYKFCRYMCVCPDRVRIAAPSKDASDERSAVLLERAPLRLTLAADARLSGPGMTLHLPPGEIEIRYLAMEGGGSGLRQLPVMTTIRRLVHSGKYDPAWTLAPEEATELGARVARLEKHADAPYIAEPAFGAEDIPGPRGTIPFIAVGGGLVALYDRSGKQTIYVDSTSVEECLKNFADRWKST